MTQSILLKGHAGPKNGCHNRKPFKDSLVVQDGFEEVGDTLVPKFRRIPFTMSRNCHYTSSEQGKADARCDGCQHRAALTQAAA